MLHQEKNAPASVSMRKVSSVEASITGTLNFLSIYKLTKFILTTAMNTAIKPHDELYSDYVKSCRSAVYRSDDNCQLSDSTSRLLNMRNPQHFEGDLSYDFYELDRNDVRDQCPHGENRRYRNYSHTLRKK